MTIDIGKGKTFDCKLLEYFNLNSNDSINNQLMAFSSAVNKIYIGIKKGEEKDLNYIYNDIEEAIWLIHFRNYLLERGCKLKDSLCSMFDYICIKCIDNTKDNKESIFSTRYNLSYYSDNKERSKRIIDDLIPYTFPQVKKSLLKSLSKIDIKSLPTFVESCIMIANGNSYEYAFDLLYFDTLKNYGVNYKKVLDYYLEIILNYIKNGPLFSLDKAVLLYNNRSSLLSFETNMKSILESKKNIEKIHEQYRSELLGLHNLIFNSSYGGAILITNDDYKVCRQIPKKEGMICYNCVTTAFIEQYGNKRKLPIMDFDSSQRDKIINIFLSDGIIPVEISNNRGYIEVEINIPLNISEYQREKLIEVKEELSGLIKEIANKTTTMKSIDSVLNSIDEISDYFIKEENRNNRKILKPVTFADREKIISGKIAAGIPII